MSEKILIVDDDASFRRIVDYTLKEEGYQTTLAEDALAALNKARQVRFLTRYHRRSHAPHDWTGASQEDTGRHT
jgi:CheY-like chemotaxis protein